MQVPVKQDSLFYEPLQACPAFLGQSSRTLWVTEPCACRKRVRRVRFGRVARPDRGSNASLRPKT